MSSIKNGSNLQLWNQVFETVRQISHNTLCIDEKAEQLCDSCNTDMYPEIHILGIFKLQNGSYAAIMFDYDASWGDFSNVRFEVQRSIEDFQSVSENEKTLIQAA